MPTAEHADERGERAAARLLVFVVTSLLAACQIVDPPEDAAAPSAQRADGGPDAELPTAVGVALVSAEVEAAEVVTAETCDSAYAVVCGARGEADVARAERLTAIARSIEAEARRALAARGTPSVSRADRALRVARAEVLAARVAPLAELVRAEHDRMRDVAIERVRASSGADRDASLARLAQSRLGWIDVLATGTREVPRRLVRGCGESLLVDDAWIDKSATEVTLCPGFLLVSTSDDEPAGGPAFRSRIAFILAHELGHVIAGAARGGAAERAAEVIADHWASEILSVDLDAIDDDGDRERYLRRALEPLCYPDGDRVHASGPDRVRALIDAHPSLDRALPRRPSAT